MFAMAIGQVSELQATVTARCWVGAIDRWVCSVACCCKYLSEGVSLNYCEDKFMLSGWVSGISECLWYLGSS